MSILVIDGYEVSIRPCEWDNLSEIFGPRVKHSTNSNEYRELMRYLSSVRMSLTELVSSDQDYYDFVKGKITSRTQSVKIYEMLDLCRDIIVGNKPGTNVLRYLLHKMSNRIIKWQYSNNRCDRLSNLYLNYGCIPFDCMPYCTSLLQHNPRIHDLFESIPASDHEHELFARYIKNNTEIDGHLFTPRSEIEGFENIDDLIITQMIKWETGDTQLPASQSPSYLVIETVVRYALVVTPSAPLPWSPLPSSALP